MKLTVDRVKELVAEIALCKEDDERAHGLEDALFEAVLEEISTGTSNAAELAIEVLKTREINFSRWCA